MKKLNMSKRTYKVIEVILAVIFGLGSIAMLYSFVRNIIDICDMATIFLTIMVGVFCAIFIWTTVCIIKNLIKENKHI